MLLGRLSDCITIHKMEEIMTKILVLGIFVLLAVCGCNSGNDQISSYASDGNWYAYIETGVDYTVIPAIRYYQSISFSVSNNKIDSGLVYKNKTIVGTITVTINNDIQINGNDFTYTEGTPGRNSDGIQISGHFNSDNTCTTTGIYTNYTIGSIYLLLDFNASLK
jgi:hypothetical protein